VNQFATHAELIATFRRAEAAGVQEFDVGYAGLKDRNAITRQWFSIYLPKGETPDLAQLQHPEFKVLSQSRHVKKLRPGQTPARTVAACC
jgi:tRNA pseudouridine13 synthase